jgi:large conductance mechanosensitive channel
MTAPMSLWKDFKAFAFKGNVIELAVAVVIGLAFTNVVTAIVKELIMPIVGKIMPGSSYLTWSPGGIHVGIVMGALLDFLIVAFVLFLVVSALKRVTRRAEAAAPPAPPAPDVVLLTEIRDLLARQTLKP